MIEENLGLPGEAGCREGAGRNGQAARKGGRSFASANVLLGCTFGREFKLRPVIGAQFRWWTGNERETDSDHGPVIGLDLEPDLRLGDKVSISPELVLRLSLIEVGGDVTSRYMGAQVVVSWRPGS